jgi:hypothetical protein
MPIATTKKPLKGGFFVSAQQCPGQTIEVFKTSKVFKMST